MVIPSLKTCYFEASEDIMTKFKLQAFHIMGLATLPLSFLPSGKLPF
jgi:hypothetical protein